MGLFRLYLQSNENYKVSKNHICQDELQLSEMMQKSWWIFIYI